MKFSTHLLTHKASGTNFRAKTVAYALRSAGWDEMCLDRNEQVPYDVDLMLQTGFAPTTALKSAIDRRIPYILAECPVFRHNPKINYYNWVSWGYNGLCGGAFHPKAPEIHLPTPLLLPLKTEGATIIFAQKPNDRSLRGIDHNAWIAEMLERYPEAEFRHHPIMHPNPSSQEPVMEALDRCHVAITYNSTAGGEAVLRGCVSNPDHWGSYAHRISTSREQWLHERSYHGFPLESYKFKWVGDYIKSGYDEACSRAEQGLVEHPRLKVMTNMSTYTSKDPRVMK